MPKNLAGNDFEELSLEEVSQALSKGKRALAPMVAFATHLQWVDGIPKVVGTPIRMSQSPAERLLETLKVSLDLPYGGNDPFLRGLSFGEVMVVQEARKAEEGDSGAFGRIMDRIVGPPVQKSQTVSIHGDLSEFLDKVSEQTKVIDITVDQSDVSDL